MTKLQKTGLIMAIVSAVLWLIWLFAWLYSHFGNVQRFPISNGEILEYDIETTHDVNYFIYYALIIIFTVWIGLLLEECSRKSLKKSLIVLVVSCLLWWWILEFSIWFFGTACAWCTDYIAYSLWIFFLSFLSSWVVSLFYVVGNITNSSKWWIVVLLAVLAFIGVLSMWTNISCTRLIWPLNWGSLLDCLERSLSRVFWVPLIISVTLCIIAWIKSHKERKKSS